MNIQPVLLSSILISALCLSACGDSKKKPKVNHMPMAMDSAVTTQADTVVTGNLMASDEDNDTLSYVIGTQPTQGTVTLTASGVFTYTPNADTTGMDEFTFVASDGVLQAMPATVKITIDPLDVNFDDYSRKAYQQAATAQPLPLNTRNIKQNVSDPAAYDDLLK